MSSGSGSHTESMPDDAYSFTISSTIYYTRTTDASGNDLVHLTKVTGSVTALSPTRIDIRSANLGIVQSGKTYITGVGIVLQSQSYNVFGTGKITANGGSFSITPPTNWYYVEDYSTSTVESGLTVSFYIPNTTNSWTNLLENYLYTISYQ